jgi:hypothetical protein
MKFFEFLIAVVQALTTIIRDGFVFGGAMTLLAVLTVLKIAQLPVENPLRRILFALSVRIGATVGAGVAAIPAATIPGVDVAYDLAAPLALLYFWITLIRDVLAILRDSRRPAAAIACYGDAPPASADPDARLRVLGHDDEAPRFPR